MLCWKVGSPLAARFIRGFVWKELAYRKMLGLHFWLEERGNISPSCFYSLVLDCVHRIYRGNQLSSSSAGAFLHLLSVTQADFEKRWFGFGCFTHSSAVVQICYCFSLGCSWWQQQRLSSRCQTWVRSCGMNFLPGISSFTSSFLKGWNSLLAVGSIVPLSQLV